MAVRSKDTRPRLGMALRRAGSGAIWTVGWSRLSICSGSVLSGAVSAIPPIGQESILRHVPADPMCPSATLRETTLTVRPLLDASLREPPSCSSRSPSSHMHAHIHQSSMTLRSSTWSETSTLVSSQIPLKPSSFTQPHLLFHSGGSPPLRSPVTELKLAQTGEGIAECELLQWFVREGDEVSPFQLVCQVQSDKATVDITSRYAGRIVSTHFVPGDIVKALQ